MTREREEAIKGLKRLSHAFSGYKPNEEMFEMAIKALEQEPCEDAISRQAAIDDLKGKDPSQIWDTADVEVWVDSLPPVKPEPNKGHCKDCKWWKDSDGMFRRGIDAESQCPMNRIEVYEGTGYCFMFEPRESEE